MPPNQFSIYIFRWHHFLVVSCVRAKTYQQNIPVIKWFKLSNLLVMMAFNYIKQLFLYDTWRNSHHVQTLTLKGFFELCSIFTHEQQSCIKYVNAHSLAVACILGILKYHAALKNVLLQHIKVTKKTNGKSVVRT